MTLILRMYKVHVEDAARTLTTADEQSVMEPRHHDHLQMKP
jgi:hypothetical protein